MQCQTRENGGDDKIIKLTSSSEPDLFDLSPSSWLPSATSFSSSSISSAPSPSSSAEEINFTLQIELY